jgi:type I restriction enzyme S subunit
MESMVLKMRKMKDSGIEWIGEIPEGWEVHRVKTHFSIISGSGFKPELQGQSTGDFPVCKASDISSSGHYLHTSANYITSDIVKSQHFSIIPKGSILFAKIGEAMRKNNRSLCLHDCCVDNNCQGLVPKNISSEFSYYLFTCIDMTWFDNAGTIPCINNQKLYDCRIPFPSYDEQLLISNHLNFQCAKINEMLFHIRSSIEEYKKLKQTVITQAVTKGVRGEREMKDSGNPWFGQIPTDWELSRVGLHFSIILGKMLCNAPLNDTYTLEPYYCAADVHFDGVADGERKKMWFSPIEKDLYRVSVGDLLVVEGGAGAGGSAIVENQDSYTYIQNSIMIVRSKGNADNRYLRYLLEFLVKQGYIDVVCNKATIPHFTKDKLSCVPFCLCGEQEEIADYLDAKCAEIDKLIAKKEQLVKELESYKKSLIYEVVTGKREV